ncbi:conserved hypothetical protein [Mesorhizobium plurifarium]|uniref:Uncharacterized protein n=2 Tax=Mesorhizobium TaxID=68287 RepID=A0A090DB27_MESPL|nr:conserved hypothetical protein [Mesorhizobium plurifarium]CDX60354.1 conserved hypothetical protein [Mesorhizobium plurifarium]
MITAQNRRLSMAEDMSRRQEQKGTARIVGWGAALILVLFLCLLAFFMLARSMESRQTPGLKRTPEQNVGQGNAPADSRPSPGVQKDPLGNYKLPNQQGG